MLTTHDISNLFQSMRTAYGAQWKHGPEAMTVWRSALTRFDAPDIERAATSSLTHHVKHPPTLPEFIALLAPPAQRANTYLPPPYTAPEKAVGNRALLKCLLDVGGVDSLQLKQMIGVRDSVIEENGDRGICEEFIDELLHELSASAALSDPDLKRKETDIAIQAFRVRQGMTAWA